MSQLIGFTESQCPACGSSDLQNGRRMTVWESANHLIPPRRSPDRNKDMATALRNLWKQEGVNIRRCARCGFGFADPFIAGDATIYNLIGDGDQHYPSDRFEFRETLAALRAGGFKRKILEIGAGSGAFLAQAIAAGLADSVTATEYDDSAIAQLRKLPGVVVVQGDVQDLAASSLPQYDAICMFQVLEHMDRIDEVFKALSKLCSPGGEVFIAVPNPDRTSVQEKHTGFLDMPPVHIGRWTEDALRHIATRHDFEFMDTRRDDRSDLVELWGLAKYRLEARTRRPDGLAGFVESIEFRPLRGVIKRMMATWDLARLFRHKGKVPPSTNWFRLRRLA